ncbi:MAG: hypothetical protein KatS3mg103_0868 [Phycisphaerales bacterium]|nr:MAG: hypothetical protein KatS3mg103_0868 [Phycisphaerales bacterium]
MNTPAHATCCPPPPWLADDGPRLTIALLGWATLSRQAEEGSGYNLNASELAIGLADLGHRVHYLCSGLRYGLGPGPSIRRRGTWMGVHQHELVNSPNLAPSAINLRNVARERHAPRTTALVLRWLSRIGVQVVHVHSLEGLSLDLIPAIEAAGIPVVVTTHNYWFLCPQVDLLHREREVCLDYDGGRRCARCLPAPSPAARRLKRRLGQGLASIVGPTLAAQARQAAGALRHALTPGRDQEPPPIDRLRYLGYREPAPGMDPHPDADLPDARPTYGIVARPQELPAMPPILPADTNDRMLANRDVHLRVLNDYGRRRQEGIAALNAASLVTPPSDFLGRVHEAMGLDPQRRRTVRLGQPHFDRMHRLAMALPGYDRPPWTPGDARPLRLGFFGTVRPNKGLRVLAEAIDRLDPAVRRRCLFLVRAAGGDWAFRKLLADHPQVQFAGGYDLLQRVASVQEYDVGLLPHIWMENSPLVLLEHLHAGKAVVASNLGGPPEWIVEHQGVRNGLLFPSGDAGALAGCIERIATGQVPLPSPRQVHAITPHLTSYPEHLAEVQRIYRDVLAGRAAGASRPIDEALQPA